MGGGAYIVLVVDNDAELAAAAARSFESVGMRTVMTLGSAPELRLFADNSVDVFVTNFKGESESRKLFQRLESWKPGVPIIVMTAHSELLKVAPRFQQCRTSRWRLASFAAQSGFGKFIRPCRASIICWWCSARRAHEVAQIPLARDLSWPTAMFRRLNFIRHDRSLSIAPHREVAACERTFRS